MSFKNTMFERNEFIDILRFISIALGCVLIWLCAK